MKKSVWAAISLGYLAAVLTAATDPERGSKKIDRLIDELNATIQERFADVDSGLFGFARIIPPGGLPRATDGRHRFRPENARELAAVKNLERAGLNAILYLGARRIISLPDPLDGKDVSATDFGLLRGPVVIASYDSRDSGTYPRRRDVWDEARKAIAAIDQGQPSYAFAAVGWHFSARPVRAADRGCLSCHFGIGGFAGPPVADAESKLKVGDALGVVLYAYR